MSSWPLIAVIAVLGFLVKIAGGLATREAAGWLSVLSESLVKRAARRLPSRDRDRWLEEQLDHLRQYDDRPISGLVHALDVAATTGELIDEIEPRGLVDRACRFGRRTVGLVFSLTRLALLSPFCVLPLALRFDGPQPAAITYGVAGLGLALAVLLMCGGWIYGRQASRRPSKLVILMVAPFVLVVAIEVGMTLIWPLDSAPSWFFIAMALLSMWPAWQFFTTAFSVPVRRRRPTTR